MRRGLKIFGVIIPVVIVVVAVALLQSGWIRPSGANLEAVLEGAGEASESTEAPAGPSAQQQWVIQTMRDATGRELRIEGDFAAWFLPTPGIVMGKASLGNEQGFGDVPFATIDGLEIRTGSISPFDREIEIERAALAGLRLNFARDAEGRDNWSDFGDGAETTPAAPAGSAPPGAAPAPAPGEEDWKVGVQVFEIIDADISLNDAFTGRGWELSAVDLRASEMRPGMPFPVSFSFTYASGETAVTIASDTRLTVTPERWLFDDVSIASSGSGTGWAGMLRDASLTVRKVDSDVLQSRAAYEGIELTLNGVDPEGLAQGLESLGLTVEPDLLERMSSSPTIRLSGDGTVDQRKTTLDLRGRMQLADGSVVPVTIDGTLAAPRMTVDTSR